MVTSFNPYPIVAVTKIIIISALLLAIVYNYKDIFGDISDTLLIVIALIGIFYILLALLLARFHTITLEEQGIAYRSGMLSVRKVVLPYSKITEAGYTQGLLQRIFGVGNLNVDTAGGATIAIHIAEMRYSDIQAILKQINDRGGHGDVDE